MPSAIQMEMDRVNQSTLDLYNQPGTGLGTLADDTPRTSDVLSAWWTNETILGDLSQHLSETRAYADETPDINFNPYVFYEQNKDQYGDLEEFMLDGTLGRTQGPQQFAAVANSIRREIENRQIIEKSEGGDFALGMAVSLLDPSTFVPIFGWASKANIARKALSTGAQVGLIVGGEEILHHQQQRARTAYESIMAVGTGTVIGGGLGALGGYLASRQADHLLHPDNPNNPLRDKNIAGHEPGSDMIVADGRRSVSEQMEAETGQKMTYDPDSGVQLQNLKMFQVTKEKPDVAVGTPKFQQDEQVDLEKTLLTRAIDKIQDVPLLRSPTTVAMRTNSGAARNLLTQMAEMGQRTVQMATGKARGMTAEAWKELSILARHNSTEERMVRAWENLRLTQGAKSEVIEKYRSDFTEAVDYVGNRQRTGDYISLADFAYLIQRKMRGGDIRNNSRNLQVSDEVSKAVEEAVAGYHSFYESLFSRAVSVGVLKKDQYIDSYLPQIWNREAIIENPMRLRAAFERKFASRYEGDEEGLTEFAKELVETLAKGQSKGFRDGLISTETFQIGKSKRAKSRDLIIKGEEFDDFEEFLIQDITRLSKQYSDDIGGRVVLAEFFGKYAGKNEKLLQFEEMGKPMEAVLDDFKRLREQSKSAKERKALERDEQNVQDAVNNLRERLLNIDRRSDSSDGALFFNRALRRTNYLRMMGGVLLSSLTDIATISLSHGASKHLSEMAKNMGKIGKEAQGMNNRELAFMLFGAEGTMSQARTAKLVGLDDDVARRGFGSGMTRKITAGIDQGLDWASNQMNYLNVMHWWNSRNKFMTGHVVLGNMLDDAARLNRGEKLANRGRRTGNYKWNELGVSDAQLRRIDELVQKHGTDHDIEGIQFRWPDLDKWLDEPDGMELATVLQTALKRSADRAVITPGIADLPMYHSSQLGQILFQFNSFGFASVNKYVRNLSDEYVHGDAMAALLSTTWALGMGATIYVVKENLIKNKDIPNPMDEPATYIYEAIDRSGLLMWMMPFMNSSMRLMAPHLESMGVEITQPSRFARSRWWTPMAGPSVGTGEMLANMVKNLADGDLEKVENKAYRMLPYRNLFWLDAIWKRAWGED